MDLNILARKPLSVLGVVVATVGLYGCWGDSDKVAEAPPPPPTPTSLTISGVAAAGPINGQVCAYTLADNGTVGTTQLACATTNATTGAYTLTITGAVGNFLLKASGTYLDEATGQTKTLAATEAIRTVIACADGATCKAAVTPLTELAVRSASSLTVANIDAALLKVAQAVGLNPSSASDAALKLVTTLPAFGSRTDASATRYADLLAVMSQAQATHCGSSNTCTLETHLAAIKTLLEGTNGVSGLQAAINAAIAAWSTNSKNTAGVTCTIAAGTISCTIGTSGGGTGGTTGGGTGGTSGACSSGKETVFDGGTNSLYTKGDKVCFDASSTALTFSGKTLTNPTALTTLSAPYSGYTFADSTGNKYEVIFKDGALYEINLTSAAGTFVGQFTPTAAGSGGSTGGSTGGSSGGSTSGNYTLEVTVNANGVIGATITVNNVPKPSTQSDFCNDTTVKSQLDAAFGSVGGTWTMNSCTFDGTNGSISATIAITSPVAMTLPYTVTYKYKP
jgi:hypothetical protein